MHIVWDKFVRDTWVEYHYTCWFTITFVLGNQRKKINYTSIKL